MKNKFNLKVWISTWAALGAIGIVIPLAMSLDYQLNSSSPLRQIDNTQTINHTRDIQDYYDSIDNKQFALQDASLKNQPASVFRINNNLDLQEINRVLGQNKIPALPESLANYRLRVVLDNRLPADNTLGRAYVKVIVEANANSQQRSASLEYFKTDGSVTNSLVDAGKQITISGFKTSDQIQKDSIINYYNEIDTNAYHSADSSTTASSVAKQISDVSSISDINRLLTSDKQLGLFNLSDFKADFSVFNVNDDNGKLTLNLVIESTKNPGTYYLPDGSTTTQKDLAGKQVVISGYQTTANLTTKAIVDYYQNLSSDGYTPANSTQTASSVVSTITAGNLTAINNVLSQTKQISILDGLIKDYSLSFLVVNSSDDSGVITVRVTVRNGNSLYKTDGALTTNPNDAGKEISITGFRTNTMIQTDAIKQYYSSLQATGYNVTDNTKKPSELKTIFDSGNLNQINNLLGTQKIPALSGLPGSFSLQFVSTPNDANGTMTVQVYVRNGNNYYTTEGVGQNNQNGAGKQINITGFSTQDQADARAVKAYYDSLGNEPYQAVNTRQSSNSIVIRINNALNANTINSFINPSTKQFSVALPNLSSQFSVRLSRATPNLEAGTLTFKATVVKNNSTLYKTDGSITTDANQAGKDITIIGYPKVPSDAQIKPDPNVSFSNRIRPSFVGTIPNLIIHGGLFDNSDTTFSWFGVRNDGYRVNDYVQLSFQNNEKYKVSRIYIANGVPGSGDKFINYKLQYQDTDGSWKDIEESNDIAPAGSTPEINDFILKTPVTTNGIRIVTNVDGTTWIRLGSFKLFGTKVTA
ncbi:lipoprotein 17-related variable surface protein [[Mycoplasma] testudinis]|uniref:lipoprotein 17-related variable surface protein n=1 Tax=[Mycoplasma] testudinis TaxID=33924 RepID=UPI000486E810|nr:lipoprotein 17-related variable surface protein [[Mycoplasma] testudinis]